MDKKTLWWLIGGIGGIILLIIILSVVSRCARSKYITYAAAEVKLVEAAKNYYADNNDKLPMVEKATSEVTSDTLIQGNYLKPFTEYLRYGNLCSARVVVTKTKIDYDYIPYLDCGEKYSSLELYRKVLEDNAIVDKGVGLYSINGEKVFRGEVKNNYVMLNNNLWRIVRIDEDNNLVLMSAFKTDTFEWDNRYNVEVDAEDGINNYNISRIRETIESDYYNGILLTESEKSKIVYTKACLGSRGSKVSGSMKSVECSELSEEELPVRLLTVGEYLVASIDPNCNTIEDRGCTNYNYMHDLPQSFWTITKGQKNSSYVYTVSTSGVFETRASNSKQIRYVIMLSSKTIYSTGSGLYDDPYIIR